MYVIKAPFELTKADLTSPVFCQIKLLKGYLLRFYAPATTNQTDGGVALWQDLKGVIWATYYNREGQETGTEKMQVATNF